MKIKLLFFSFCLFFSNLIYAQIHTETCPDPKIAEEKSGPGDTWGAWTNYARCYECDKLKGKLIFSLVQVNPERPGRGGVKCYYAKSMEEGGQPEIVMALEKDIPYIRPGNEVDWRLRSDGLFYCSRSLETCSFSVMN